MPQTLLLTGRIRPCSTVGTYADYLHRSGVARFHGVSALTVLLGLAVMHARSRSLEPLLIRDKDLRRAILAKSKTDFANILKRLSAGRLLKVSESNVAGCSNYQLRRPTDWPPLIEWHAGRDFISWEAFVR